MKEIEEPFEKNQVRYILLSGWLAVLVYVCLTNLCAKNCDE